MIQIKEDSFLIYPFETLEGVDKCRICVVLKKKKLVIIGKDLTLDFIVRPRLSVKVESRPFNF